jgi:hypothetical protein
MVGDGTIDMSEKRYLTVVIVISVLVAALIVAVMILRGKTATATACHEYRDRWVYSLPARCLKEYR